MFEFVCLYTSCVHVSYTIIDKRQILELLFIPHHFLTRELANADMSRLYVGIDGGGTKTAAVAYVVNDGDAPSAGYIHTRTNFLLWRCILYSNIGVSVCVYVCTHV